jgi:hypothetical protein
MKRFENLGKALTKEQQKQIVAGSTCTSDCGGGSSVSCSGAQCYINETGGCWAFTGQTATWKGCPQK